MMFICLCMEFERRCHQEVMSDRPDDNTQIWQQNILHLIRTEKAGGWVEEVCSCFSPTHRQVKKISNTTAASKFQD